MDCQGAGRWDAGKDYFFELRSNVDVDFGTPSNAVAYDMSAKAVVDVVEHTEGRTTLRLRLMDVVIANRLVGKGTNFDKFSEDVAHRDCVFVMSSGRLTEFGLREGTAGAVAATYRQIASSFQFQPSKCRKEWESDEYDGTGQYLVRYSADSTLGVYHKEKIRYLGLLGHPSLPGGASLQTVPDVKRSTGRIEVAPDGSVQSVELQDDLVLKGAQEPIKSSNHVVLNLLSAQPAQAAIGLPAVMGAYTFVQASEADRGKAGIEALDDARTQGASFREIIARMEKARQHENLKSGKRKGKRIEQSKGRATQAGATTDVLLFNALAASLRRQPDAVRDAVEMVRRHSEMSGVLIDALATASSAECEEALVALSESGDDDVSASARYALTRLARPGRRSVKALEDLDAREPFNQFALYGIGSYAKRFADNGNPEKAAELGEFLIQRLASARGATSRITVLRAIENSGYVAALAHIQRYLGDRDDVVRAAAIDSLRNMKDPAADKVLVTRLSPDIPAGDRLVALEVAKVRGSSDLLVNAVSACSNAPEMKVRRKAVALLVDWVSRNPSLRSLLDRIAKSDPEPQIRLIALKAK